MRKTGERLEQTNHSQRLEVTLKDTKLLKFTNNAEKTSLGQHPHLPDRTH